MIFEPGVVSLSQKHADCQIVQVVVESGILTEIVHEFGECLCIPSRCLNLSFLFVRGDEKPECAGSLKSFQEVLFGEIRIRRHPVLEVV